LALPEKASDDGGTDPGADSAVAEWTAILDTLEEAADQADALLHRESAGPSMGRTPAVPSVPMPAQVRERALRLVERQENLMTGLEAARAATFRQLQAVTSVPGIGQTQAAVYLDVTG
jgi:hypothetical protein